jgi:hypothetical protein
MADESFTQWPPRPVDAAWTLTLLHTAAHPEPPRAA